MQERTVPLPITISLLIAAVVIVSAFMKTKEYTQIVPNFPETAEAAVTTQTTFKVSTAASWHYTVLAERDIQEFGEGQRILDGILTDPNNGAIAYFATAAFDNDAQTMTLSIYRYNMQNLSFTCLYRSNYGKGQSRFLAKSTWPVWHVIGYDRERLVVLLQNADAETAPCDIPLLLGMHSTSATLLTLSLNDITGLETYIPQEEDVTAAQAVRTACMNP